ncbi:MAG: polysaccharide pyruvyl transferase CsaB [Cyanobacteriota bacterium]|nr:polysaccharide pyruvyl transferase CsaB [Cyanobacteriota bacterium]
MRAVLCGYYGEGNGGDEALLATLLQLLPPSVTAVVLSANPAQTRERYGVESIPNRDWGTILQTLRTSQVFIWGGGSLMQDSTSLLSPWYYGGLMALAQLLGLTTLAWAQGVGPLNRAPTRWLTRQVLSRCQGVTVRDQASAQLLRQWQIPHQLGPDPVWLLDGVLTSPSRLPPPVVAVNLRPHPLLTPQRREVLTEALVHFQQATGAHLRLIPFQKSQDLPLAEALAQNLTGAYEILYREDPRELKGLFQGADLTIGMRLHSLIMAASEGNRTFALSYDPKVSRLMAEVGLPGWELAQLPMNYQAISQTWQAQLTDSAPLSLETREDLRRRTEVHRDLLLQTLG